MGSVNEPIRKPLTLDVSSLPSVAFGHRNTTWLANVFYMAIEGMMFALIFATYFYLRTRSTNWPPGHLPPALGYGVLNAVIFLTSIIPAWMVRKRAPEGNRQVVRNGLLVLTLFALAATVLRVFEFSALSSLGCFVHSKNEGEPSGRCGHQFRLLVFRGYHGFTCRSVDLRDDSVLVRGIHGEIRTADSGRPNSTGTVVESDRRFCRLGLRSGFQLRA
jgi:hypothetical protein